MRSERDLTMRAIIVTVIVTVLFLSFPAFAQNLDPVWELLDNTHTVVAGATHLQQANCEKLLHKRTTVAGSTCVNMITGAIITKSSVFY
jgi:TRAP-type uncharacterized transport system fused permease subunit